MSETSAPRDGRSASGGSTVDRPARIDELRAATALEELDGSGLDDLQDLPTAPADRPPRPAAPAAAPAGDERRSRRALVVGIAAVAVVVVVAAAFLLTRSSESAAPAGPAPSSGPSTSAPKIVAAPEVVAEEQRQEAMCTAASTYSIDDLPRLGETAASDPDAFLAAYETLAVNVPSELHALVDQMAPLTRRLAAAVKSGQITSASDVQVWLALVPAPELEAWVGPQQELAPTIAELCR